MNSAPPTALERILAGCGLSDAALHAASVHLSGVAAPGIGAKASAPQVACAPEPEPTPETQRANPIPAELRAIPQWVGWKYIPEPGKAKPRKLLINPRTGKAAKSNDPQTWSGYDTAVLAAKRYRLAGVGFVFSSADPYCGVDLDNCRNKETGAIAQWAKHILDRLKSYSEVSPSGTGIKVFLKGKLPANAKHDVRYQTGSVEVYDSGRYFTVTGEHVPGTLSKIEDRQVELTAVYSDVFGQVESTPAPVSAVSKLHEKGDRWPHLRSMVGTEKRRGTSDPAIKALIFAENTAACNPPIPEHELEKKLTDLLNRKLPDANPSPTPLESFLSDSRPKLRLRGDNRLLSDVASELGPHLSKALSVHNGEVVEYRDRSLRPIGAQEFRTLAERHVTFYRVRSFNQANVQVGATLDESDARGILASPQFLECLKPIRHLNTVRLPVIRSNGSIELLPAGYDLETATLTDATVNYSESMAFADAVETIRDLFGEFQFSDGERSRAVAVVALLGLYGKQLIKPGELRPAFTFVKNAEGAGATTLAACAIIPVCGNLPIGCKARDDDETRKALTSAIRSGQEVFFLDNLKGHLDSPALEAFVSTPTWSDRLLGGNETITGPNTVTVFITSNGLTISPDWRRRSLFAELHLSEERAEDRVYKRPLSVPVLQAMRPTILAACWSMIRHWDALGRPQPSRAHSAFPAWAGVVGGIVESAGFGCPFVTPNVAIVADEDGQGMRGLVAGMAPGTAYTSSELVNLCRAHNLFEGLIGASDADMGRAQRSAFGKLLARYNDRTVSDVRFFVSGTGHAKRFLVHPLAEGSPVQKRKTETAPPESEVETGEI